MNAQSLMSRSVTSPILAARVRVALTGGHTQTAIAKAAGCDLSALSHWLHGRRPLPDAAAEALPAWLDAQGY